MRYGENVLEINENPEVGSARCVVTSAIVRSVARKKGWMPTGNMYRGRDRERVQIRGALF